MPGWGLGRGKGGEGTVPLLPLAGSSGGDYRVCSLDRGVLPFSLVIPESFSFLLIKGIPGLSWYFCVKMSMGQQLSSEACMGQASGVNVSLNPIYQVQSS